MEADVCRLTSQSLSKYLIDKMEMQRQIASVTHATKQSVYCLILSTLVVNRSLTFDFCLSNGFALPFVKPAIGFTACVTLCAIVTSRSAQLCYSRSSV